MPVGQLVLEEANAHRVASLALQLGAHRVRVVDMLAARIFRGDDGERIRETNLRERLPIFGPKWLAQIDFRPVDDLENGIRIDRELFALFGEIHRSGNREQGSGNYNREMGIREGDPGIGTDPSPSPYRR